MTVLCLLLGIACYFDYRKGKIPNILLLLMAVAGWGYCVWKGGIGGAVFFPLWSGGVMLVLYPVFKIGALGAGDVKLYGICAGCLPPDKFLFFLFFSMLIAAIISLIKMLKENNALERISYLCQYIMDVVRTGSFHLYLENQPQRQAAGICLAGPILGSLCLHLGGIY